MNNIILRSMVGSNKTDQVYNEIIMCSNTNLIASGEQRQL